MSTYFLHQINSSTQIPLTTTKMINLMNIFGISKQFEVLLIILIGGCVLVFDESIFKIYINLKDVWETPLNAQIFPIYIQTYLRYIISGVVLFRTCTAHLFLAFYIVMLWPAIFEDRPNLILPWLLIGFIRSIVANMITLFVGSYVCLATKGPHLLCLEYLFAQFIDHGPAIYAWMIVMSYYYELLDTVEEYIQIRKRNEVDLAARRRRARCMMNFTDKCDDGRNLVSESTINHLEHYFQKTINAKQSRSLDSLLQQKAAAEEQEVIMYGEDEDEPEPKGSVVQRAIKLLRIDYDDISRAKLDTNERSMQMLSEYSAAPFTGRKRKRILSAQSSDSFFVKNGRVYKVFDFMKQCYKIKMMEAKGAEHHHDATSSSTGTAGVTWILPSVNENAESDYEVIKNEVELGNVILESKESSGSE